jgi:DNA polymerase I-like protein with 3'-5' exonuclease and polymerase domains
VPRIREFRWDSWAQWTLTQILHDLPAAIAVDTETTGVAWSDVPFCATLTWRSPEGTLKSGYIGLDSEDTLPMAGAGRESPIGDLANRANILREILTWVPTWVFWNAKFDLEKLDEYGALPAVEGHTIEDGQPIASLLNENRRMKLKVRAVEDLGYVDTIEVEIKSGPNKGKTKKVAKEEHVLAAVRRKLKLKKEDGYHLLPRENLIPYALTDTELTLRWWEKHRPLLDEAWEPIYAEEIELIRVLWKMERNGIALDVPYLQQQTDEYGAEVMRLWQELVKLTGKADFNANSVPQLHEAFTAAGAGKLESTDKAAMRDMLADPTTPAAARELAETLHEYREAEKIYGTYLTSLLSEQADGIAHPWINLVGPRTGRMSSSKAVA